jgi:hypothetical protein
VKLAEEAVSLERTLEEIEAEQKQIKARLNQITIKELPEKLAELGMDDFKLANGSTIKIKDVVAGSLPKDPEAKSEALAYLETIDGGALIKNEISVSFDRGSDNFAKNAFALLEENGYEPSIDKGVNHMTLQSFVREKLKNGEEIDVSKIGIFVGRKAEIKLGKK